MSGIKRLLGLAALIAGLPAIGAVTSVPHSGQVAVLFDPRLERAELARVAAEAEVRIVRFGALPGSLIVDLGEADGPGALRRAGAWLIADPIILGGCATSEA
jgi:hypothetical protein